MRALSYQKKRTYGSMRRLNAWLAVAILLVLLVAADVCGYVWTGGHLSILRHVDYATTLQNNRVASDGGTTYLGTYKDAVIAVNADGTEAWRFDTAGSVAAIACDSARSLVVAASQGRMLYILDAATGKEIRSVKTGGVVNDMDYDLISGNIVLSAPSNKAKGQVALYDLELNQLLKKSGRPARSVVFAPDGQSFYTGDSRASVTRLTLDGEEMASAKLDNEIYALAVSADTGDVVAISDEGTVARFDASLNETFRTTLTGNGRSCAVSGDGALTGAGTREGDVYILDENGKAIYSTRLSAAIQQIVIDGENGFVVPWNEELFTLDISAAAHFALYTRIHEYAFYGLFVLPVLCALAFVLAFGKSRSAFMAFFASMHRHRVAYLMLVPSFALILLFNYYPIGQAFYYAFTDWNYSHQTMRDVRFVGLDNFVKMITEGYFLLGVKNMLIMMLFGFLKLFVPLLVAELVFSMSGGKRRYWFRFLLVLPMVVPGVVSALMWKNIYDPSIGLINQVLTLIGRQDLCRSWLGNEATALGAIIFMGFPWVNSFAFLVFYGGLINIPGDLFEAARVDGSNPFWNLTRIHLPLITPQIKMIVILTFISAIQDYGGVLLLTNGGPGYATYVPGFELYLNATLLGQYGYACALGLVMFVAILAGTILNLKLKTEEALG